MMQSQACHGLRRAMVCGGKVYTLTWSTTRCGLLPSGFYDLWDSSTCTVILPGVTLQLLSALLPLLIPVKLRHPISPPSFCLSPAGMDGRKVSTAVFWT